jgi:hypothetical protein
MDLVGRIHSVFVSPYTWGVVALLALAFTASGRFNVTAANVFLWLAWGAAVFGVYRAEPVLHLDVALRILVIVSVASLFGIGVLLVGRFFAQKPEPHPIIRNAKSKSASSSAPAGPSGIARIPPPINPPATAPFIENPDEVFFSLGDGMTVGQSVGYLRQMPPFNFEGYTPVIVHMLDGQMHLRFRIWNGDEKSPIEVNDNQFVVRPPGWDSNFSDNALEVVDQHHRVIFQMIKRTPTRVLVNGIFPKPNGRLIVAGNGSCWPNVAAIPGGFVLRPLFKYPLWKYRGVYAEY